jgi:hypothetical protein
MAWKTCVMAVMLALSSASASPMSHKEVHTNTLATFRATRTGAEGFVGKPLPLDRLSAGTLPPDLGPALPPFNGTVNGTGGLTTLLADRQRQSPKDCNLTQTELCNGGSSG